MPIETRNETREIALHEAAHSVVAWHFGIYCHAEIVPVEDRKTRAMQGVAKPDPFSANLTPFRDALLTWAGPIMDWVTNDETSLDEILTHDYPFWVDWLADWGDWGCGGDRDHLEKIGYLYRARPGRIAAGILKRRHSELESAAAELERTGLLESRIKITPNYKGRRLPYGYRL